MPKLSPWLKQGRWTNWEGLEKKRLSWHDIWQMEEAQLSFTIRAMNHLLPSPENVSICIPEAHFFWVHYKSCPRALYLAA